VQEPVDVMATYSPSTNVVHLEDHREEAELRAGADRSQSTPHRRTGSPARRVSSWMRTIPDFIILPKAIGVRPARRVELTKISAAVGAREELMAPSMVGRPRPRRLAADTQRARTGIINLSGGKKDLVF